MRFLVLVAGVILFMPSFAFAADIVVPTEAIVPSLDRISWAAVMAGAIVALATHMTLSALGVGIGAGVVDPYDRKNSTKSVPRMMLVWMVVSGLISLSIGAWLSGRLAGTVPFDSTIHGIITWAVATVVMFLLATTSLGYIISGTFHLLGKGASTALDAAATVAPEAAKLAKETVEENIPQLNWKSIEREAKKALKIGNDKDAIDVEDVGEMLTKAYGSVRDNLPAVDRESLIKMMVDKAVASKEEATQTVEKWEKMYREAKRQYEQVVTRAENTARDAADAATTAVSRIGIWTFASLLLGAGISGLAGNLGSTYFRL